MFLLVLVPRSSRCSALFPPPRVPHADRLTTQFTHCCLPLNWEAEDSTLPELRRTVVRDKSMTAECPYASFVTSRSLNSHSKYSMSFSNTALGYSLSLSFASA